MKITKKKEVEAPESAPIKEQVFIIDLLNGSDELKAAAVKSLQTVIAERGLTIQSCEIEAGFDVGNNKEAYRMVAKAW